MPDNIGQTREKARYFGDPNTSAGARARRSADRALTSDQDYMKDAVSDTAKTLTQSAQQQTDAKARLASPKKFAKGGMVKRTGMALVHKGERVLTKAQQLKRH